MIQNFWLCWMITNPGGPVGSYINALLKKRLWFKAGLNWEKGGYQIVPLTRWCKILELYSVFTWRHGGNNNETAAMLVFQTNPVGIKLLSYVKAFFFPRHFHRRWLREWKRSIRSVLIREQDPWLGIYRDVWKTKPKEQPSAFFQDHAQQAPLTTRKINKLHERHLGNNHKLFSDNVDYEH